MLSQICLFLGRFLVLGPGEEQILIKVIKVLVRTERDVRLLQILWHRFPSEWTARIRLAIVAELTSRGVCVVYHRTSQLVWLAANHAPVSIQRARQVDCTVRVGGSKS